MVLCTSVALAADGNAPLTILIVPHSHCDPGWLMSAESYYSNYVRNIIRAVVDSLHQDSSRRFVWSETYFISQWYEEQNEDTRAGFRQLVEQGRLEFVGGGWVSPDEASVSPNAIIDNYMTGHRYLQKTFGVVPKVAWQVDPFGHSSITPMLLGQIGFEGIVINRIHHTLKEHFKRNRQLEFVWRSADVNATRLLTHVLHSHYSAPHVCIIHACMISLSGV